MSKNKENNLQDFFQGFADAEDAMSFKMGDELEEFVEGISTGSYLIDDISNCGGFPRGRISQLYGAPAGGKTLISLLTIAQAQRQNPDSQQLFLDAEGTFNRQWAAQLGVDLSRLGIVDVDIASDGQAMFDMLIGIPREDKQHFFAGWKKEGLLTKIAKKELNIDLIILDSIQAVIPPAESVTTVGKTFMAPPLAKFLTTSFRKLSPQVKKSNVAFLVINHKKDTFEMYGPNHTYAGGNAYSHYLSFNLYVEPRKAKDALLLNDKEEVIGREVCCTSEKCKMGPWPKSFNVKLNFTEGFTHLHEEIAELAIKYDAIEKPNDTMYHFGEFKWRGRETFNKAVKEDPQLAEQLLIKIRESQAQEKLKTLPKTPDSNSNEDSSVESASPEETKSKRSKKQ